MSAKTETDDIQEIIADFLIEADDLVQSLNTNLGRLSSTPNDPELLNQIFRAAHTIKGISSFLHFEQVTELTHDMEEVLNRLRKGELEVTPKIIDVLFFALDTLKQLLDDVRNGTKKLRDITSIYNQLLEVTDQKKTAPKATEESEQVAAPEPPRKIISDQTIRVDIQRLDTLMNFVSELVFARNSLMQSTNTFTQAQTESKELESLNNASRSISYITNELYAHVMKMRMQPIGRLFGRFPRLVRDLCRDSGKQIDLVLTGETTELDRSLIEALSDPLIHLLRNAVHHGIESQGTRLSRGKPACGTIQLSAAQAGSYLEIKVKDDGNGLDVDAIRNKAIERKLITAEQANQLSREQLFRFILEPGFTTARKVTDISGRGVGMDVVRANVEQLNGQVELESNPGMGTVITLRIPLTLAATQGILVQSGNEVYILQVAVVHEIVRSNTANLAVVGENSSIVFQGEIVRVYSLERLMNMQASQIEFGESEYIVIVAAGGRKIGLAVDCLLGQEEVVVKPLGSYLGPIEGITGAAILGDGRARLIIDPAGLFGLAARQS